MNQSRKFEIADRPFHFLLWLQGTPGERGHAGIPGNIVSLCLEPLKSFLKKSFSIHFFFQFVWFFVKAQTDFFFPEAFALKRL